MTGWSWSASTRRSSLSSTTSTVFARRRRSDAIAYPVAVDNDYAIWIAFDNHYWPALYFVDSDGIIRDHHFGEGRYEESERVIQQLLGVERELVPSKGLGVEAEADWAQLRTPETYLGYGRSERFASPGMERRHLEHRHFALPERLRLNEWALAGQWRVESEYVVVEQPGGSIAFRFLARDAHLVLSCRVEDRFRSVFCWTGRLRGLQTGSTSTKTGTGCSSRGAFTSSCVKTARWASGRSRSSSTRLEPRRTCSRSGDGLTARGGPARTNPRRRRSFDPSRSWPLG